MTPHTTPTPQDEERATAELLASFRKQASLDELRDPQAFARFIDLATAGRSSKASTGERACFRLAQALHEIGDDMALLDPGAIAGAIAAIVLASGPYPTDRDKDFVFRNLRRAGD